MTVVLKVEESITADLYSVGVLEIEGFIDNSFCFLSNFVIDEYRIIEFFAITPCEIKLFRRDRECRLRTTDCDIIAKFIG